MAEIGKIQMVSTTLDIAPEFSNAVKQEAGGGVSDYDDLTNKPSLNGVTIEGDKTNPEYGITNTIKAALNTTISGYVVPMLTVEQVTEAYNSINSGSLVVVEDATETQRFVVKQSDALNDEPAVEIVYYDTGIVTYLILNDQVETTFSEFGGDGDAVKYTPQTLTEAQKIQALKNLDGVRVIPLTDGTETLDSIKTRLSTINNNGEHVFFDTASIGYKFYLCAISIEYDEDENPTTYRLNDIVSGSASLGSYDATKTLAEILAEAVNAYYTLTVICTTQDGVTVTGQTVTIRKGGADGLVYKTVAYDGQPVSVVVPDQFAYYVSVSDNLPAHFSPTTASGLISSDTTVTLTYGDASHITTFADVQGALQTLDDPTVLIGLVEIEDSWVDENGVSYSDPMIVADVKTVTAPDDTTHTAAIMVRKWAGKVSMPFDAPENEEATEENALAGIYYAGMTGSTFTKLSLSEGDPIPYTDYDKVLHNAINFNGSMYNYGYSRWSHSAQRQYLNSSAAVGGWWTAQHLGDVAPSILSTTRGYKAGCSAALLAAAKPIKITSALNTVTDTEFGTSEQTVDTFWLPSGIELYGTANTGEGTYFPYYKNATGLTSPSDAANAGRIHYAIESHSSAQSVRLRSCYQSYSYHVWYCNSSGQLHPHQHASNAYRALPACAIY